LSNHGIMPASEKVLDCENVFMVISIDAKMTRLNAQFDYVRGNIFGRHGVVIIV
jgi:hypothetical protein